VDVVSYNTLLKAYARSGDVKASFELFERFLSKGIEPDDVTFSTLLDVCIDEDEHQLASVALERMSEHGVQMNCVVLTTLMKGFVRSKRLDKAMQLYDSMRSSSIKPDMITHSMLIKAFCDASDMGSALRILEDLLESGCDIDDVVFTHLIEGCAQVTNVRLAERLFQDMRRAKIAPSVYTLNGLVKIYGKQREYQAQAAQLIRTMEAEFGVKPTVVVYTCLLSGQIRTKSYADAWKTFCWMRETLKPDLQGFQTMVTGLSDGGLWTELSTLAPEYAAALCERNHTQSECLNHALTVCCNRYQAACAGALVKTMADHGIEVTVPHSRLPK
jgi:pentatricopeptide repeat protein